MIVEVVTADLRTVTLRASRVLVRYDDGNPAAVAVEVGPEQVAAATAEHADFNAILQALGLGGPVAALRADGRTGLILPG